MLTNEEVIRELYAASEGHRTDINKVVSLFAPEGYMRDMSSGVDCHGKEIGDSIAGFRHSFPDVHREIFSLYVAKSVVIVELAIRGMHRGELTLPSGSLAPTGRSIDVPSCDVFHLASGKITSFHCYRETSVMLQQLGLEAA
ncbi:MAG: ester cyclase [Mycobacterium sp.]